LVEDTKRQIMDDGKHGQINLSAIPTIAPFLLPRILSEVGSMFPAAKIQIHEDATANLVARCVEGDVDIGIVALPITAKNLTIEPLFSEELLLAMPSSHPLVGRPEITVKDILQETFILLGSSHCLVEVIESFCRERNFQPVAQSRIEQLDTVINLVARGHGLSFIPQMAAESAKRDNVVYRSLAGDQPIRKIAVCYNSERFQSQLVTNLLKALRECLDNGTVDWYQTPEQMPKKFTKSPNSLVNTTP
jgi:LysR family hydrogen peroxide-inducible transcriptional activator